jgi:hypothetical protein
LAILSAVSYSTGDARAGTVMAAMVVLSLALRFLDPSRASVFQPGWFVESLMTQTLIIRVIRTNKIPFLQSRASWPLMLTACVVPGTHRPGADVQADPAVDVARLRGLHANGQSLDAKEEVGLNLDFLYS